MNRFNPYNIAVIGTEDIESRSRKNFVYSYNLMLLFFIVLISFLVISEIISGNPKGVVFASAGVIAISGIYLLSRNKYSVLSTALFNFLMPLLVLFLTLYYEDVKHTSFYTVFFICFAIIFSVSNSRKTFFVIYCACLFFASGILSEKYGYISPHKFDEGSNLGLLMTFGIGVCLLVYQIIVKGEKDEKYVDELLLSLKANNIQLEESNKKLEQFSQIASHDLKVPIVGVGSLVDIIERKINKQEMDGIPEIIGAIKKSTTHMATMIEDTLEYGKISQKTNSLFANVDLQLLVNETAKDLKYSFPKAQFKINNLPTIYTNRELIQKVIQNLMQNGLKYNTSDEPTITLSCKNTRDYLEIEVSDDGIGIPQQHIDEIFVPYKRLHPDDKYTGTGLGLSIVKDIMNMLDGEINVRSSENEGTTFTVSLPRINPALEKSIAIKN